jgi:transposase InsO family protein
MSKPERLIEDDLKKTTDYEALRELYYNKRTGLSSFDKLWRKVRKEGLNYTQKEVKSFLKRQSAAQLTKEFKKPRQFTTIRAPEPGTNLQMDLMFFSPKIKGKTGVLNVVDVHSRKAFSELIANKKEATVLKAFQKILAEIAKDGKKVRHVNSDDGKEFVSAWKLLQDNGIQLHKSRVKEFAKNAIVERFNRTLRNLMRKYEAEFPRAGLVEDWDDLIGNYNESYHRTIKAEPGEVWSGDDKNKQDYKDIKYAFQKGDKVRVLYKKELFEKGTYGWEPQIYVITRILRTDDYNWLEQKHFVAPISASGATGQEKSDWYMGYELQKVEGVERSPDFDEKKKERSEAQVEKKKAEAQQKRRLAKEGLDDAAPPTRGRRPPRKK